jgi:uncharacterized protein YndB with AHSA1/START domain
VHARATVEAEVSSVVVTRVISAPVERVWAVFTDLRGRAPWLSEVEIVEVLTPGPLAVGSRWRETRTDRRGRPVTEELVVVAVDPHRSCTLALTGVEGSQLTYVFTSVDVGPHRGATAVTAIAEAEHRPHGLKNRLVDFFVAGLAARTAEGALRDELDALAAECEGRLPAAGREGAAA